MTRGGRGAASVTADVLGRPNDVHAMRTRPGKLEILRYDDLPDLGSTSLVTQGLGDLLTHSPYVPKEAMLSYRGAVDARATFDSRRRRRRRREHQR